MVAGVSTAGLVLLASVGLGGLVSLALAVVFVRRGLEAPGTRSFVLLMLACTGWSFAYVLQLLASNHGTVVAFELLYSGCSLLVAASWVTFAVDYTGNGEWLTRRRSAAMYGFLGVFFVLLVTNRFNGWLRVDVSVVTVEGLSLLTSDRTLLMWAFIGGAYLFIVFGYVRIGRFFLSTRNVYRKQTALILLGGVLIGAGNVLYFAGAVPIEGFDPTPLLFVANGVVIAVALVRYDFLEVVPLAADVLIEEMDDPVIVVGTDDEVLDCNAAAAELFDADPVGESLPSMAPELAAAIASGTPFRRRSGRPRADGRSVYDPRTTPIEDPYGIERGTLVVLRDITVQAHRQEELVRQNERLEEFAAVVSHDLRNPLSVAHAYAQTAIDEEDVSLVGQTLESLDRMDELIGDLLTLAREGQTVDAVAPVSLETLAKRAWDQVETRDATLVVKSDATVRADDRRLRQLFENLFRNAVEHAGHDVTVTVGAIGEGVDGDDGGNDGDDGGTGRDGSGFFVADDGPGVPPDARETVFERGYSSTTDGTGFGLAIVRTIAEAHGWSVAVDESDDGGARFLVSGVSTAQEIPS